MLEPANKSPAKLPRRSGAFGGAARGRKRDRAQSSARPRQPRDENMNEPNEAASTPEFLADEPGEESAVRMSSGFAPAGDAPGHESAYFDAVPASTGETRESTAPAAHEDMAGDSTLSRYFREMATHQVMGPDE